MMFGLSWRWTLAALLILAIAVAGVAWRAYEVTEAGSLLRADPDAPGPNLTAFAVARAKPLYAAHCAACHGADLKGDRRFGAPDLTDPDWLYGEGRASEIEQTVTFGIRSGDPRGRNLASMPAFAQAEPYARYHIPPLAPRDVRDVTDYLLMLGGRPADPAAAARGDTIYHTRGGCYDCHGTDAAGDEAIGSPNLKDAIWLYGDGLRGAIEDSIAQGRAGACPAWIHRLSAADIRALAIFVRSRSISGSAKAAHP